MARSDDQTGDGEEPSRAADAGRGSGARPYAFDESAPRFRVVVGSERRPTGFLIRASDENEARRQLLIAAIRLGFDRRGESVALERVDE